MNQCRLQLDDTLADVVAKMSEGNPGAITVCLKIFKEADKIDPDNIMGGWGTILFMDSLAIYGSRIWMLYKDVCKENIAHTVGLLRSHQLGFLQEKELNTAIDNYGKGINVNDLIAQVKVKLPKFNDSYDN